MKIVVLFQIRTGDGNPERTKQNRRPAWASKKEWEFPQWQMLMVTLRRVYMSQSAQVFSKFDSIPASLLSHVDSIPRKKLNLRDQRRSSLMDGAAVPFSWSIVSMRWQLMLTGISGCRSIASWWSERSISTLCGSDEWFGASWLFELGSSTLLIHSIIRTSK